MTWTGGPYLNILDLNAGFDLNYGSSIGPINLPYQRTNDSLQEIVDLIIESYVPWEWWIDYDGTVYLDERRGTDKTASITITVSKHIGHIEKQTSTKQTFQRVRVVGRGESAEQDMITSDWYEDTGGMDDCNSFYEKVETEKSLSSKEESDIQAAVIATENAHPREEISITLENDEFTANDFDIGDDVTVYDSDYDMSEEYRIKTIDKTVDDSGEHTILVVTKVRTDITNRLAYLQRQVEKIKSSSTYLDRMYAEGGYQTKISANAIEDIWEQTASNKWAMDLPEEESDDPNLSYCNYVDHGDLAFACDKDEFEVYSVATNAYGSVFKTDPLLKFSRDPRFTCDFEVDTTGADRDEWQEGDMGIITIREIDTMCGGADPDNPDRYCCDPLGTSGFGFCVYKSATHLELRAYLATPTDGISVKIDNIDYNTKYSIEARMEWKSKVVLFYYGKPDVDESDVDGFKLRAVVPIRHTTVEDNLCPFHVLIDAVSEATKVALVIYRWKTQAVRAVKS